MLHLRILVPADLTPAVESLLRREPSVVHVTLVRGAAVDPDGDLFEGDIETSGLAAVLSRLEDLGVTRRGSLSFSDILDARSRAADAARARDRTLGAEFIAWDEVAARTREDVAITPPYLILMILAGTIAAAGILTNNELLIVGAMIVSPDYGPLAGLCVALVSRQLERARSSAWAMVAGFLVAGVSAGILAGLAVLLDLVPATYVAGVRPVTDLIAEPNVTSLIVALAAGIAGMIALGQAKSGAVVGVLVSVTTIPAAANVGVAIVLGHREEAIGALTQLIINVLGLVVAGVGSLWIGRRLSRARAIADIRRRRADRRTGGTTPAP